MSREEYEALLELVKPDVEGLLDLLQLYGKIKNKVEWYDRWQEVWKDNLDSCDKSGMCSVILS